MQCKNHESVTLTDLPRALRDFDVSASYQQCWRAVVSGDIPARRAGRKWLIAENDVPTVARFFEQTSQAV